MFQTVQQTGGLGVSRNFRCDLEIQVLNHPVPSSGADVGGGATAPTDEVAMRFKVYNAWPTTVAYSDLNAGDNALYVEQMTLVHEGFDLNWASIDPKTSAVTSAASFD